MQVRMKDCGRRGDFKEASSINRSFHRMINQMAESPKLMSTLRSVSLGIQGDFISEVPEWLSRSIDEHEQIIDAMRRGDSDRAGELMFLHTQGSAIKITDDLAGFGNGDGIASFDGIPLALSAVFDDWSEAPLSDSFAMMRDDDQ
jgi:DNA-binding GntR family transcriptional regulator